MSSPLSFPPSPPLPPGSGKTSLLNILAARVDEAASTRLTGQVLVNGQERGSTFRRISAYVMQDDILFSTLTVWETLVTAAQLRLPSAIPLPKKLELVESIISELGRGEGVGRGGVGGIYASVRIVGR